MDNTLLSPAETSGIETLLERAAKEEVLVWGDLFELILEFPAPSYAPLHGLSALLSDYSKPPPVFELQQTYTKAWKKLPEIAKAANATSEARSLIDGVTRLCKASYTSLADLLHQECGNIAIIDPETTRSIRHNDLAASIRSFRLPLAALPGEPKPVVAISLPNGPMLALAVFATATWYTAAPIAHGSGVAAEQFKTDVLQSRSTLVLASAIDVDRLDLRGTWLSDAGIDLLLVELSDDMRLVVRHLDGTVPSPHAGCPRPQPNGADDTGILLFTSGTSGTKKLVPLSIHSMVCGMAMVIESWNLSPSMRCLNQMPLNHVGGLIRNLFAPVCSGGSVICCSAFDANLFWDCVDDYSPTWYYASPTMHQCILEAALDRPESVCNSQIQLVCNAAGGLLPSLAGRLRDTFSTAQWVCTILPSYGMTECMPISTPPLDYRLGKTGTSGTSVGPEIAILDGREQSVETSIVGRICVRGAPLFQGYLRADNSIDDTCFSPDGWFDTGDLGYLDNDSFLYISGRSKEVINRGGELISNLEVEQAVVAASAVPDSRLHGRVSKALAFSVAHDVLQEVVGIAVVTPAGSPRTCLRDVQDAVKSALSQVKIPVLLVFMDDLPTNNGKVLRVRLGTRLGLPEISDSTSQAERHYDATCPPPNTPLTQAVNCKALEVGSDNLAKSCQKIIHNMDIYIRSDNSGFYQDLFLAPDPAHPGTPVSDHLDHGGIIDELSPILHGYDRPSKVYSLQSPFQRRIDGTIDEEALDLFLGTKTVAHVATDLSSTETAIATIFGVLLGVPLSEIFKSSSFFDLGGSSMSAGQLLSKLRKQFQVRVPIDELFNSHRIAELAALIDRKLALNKSVRLAAEKLAEPSPPELPPGCEETHSSMRRSLLLLQLLPLGVFYPMKRAFTWTVFIYFLAFTQTWYTDANMPGRVVNLVLSMAVGRMATKVVAPLLAISVKWLLITHVEGLFPMWGSYHTRWWLCQKVVAISGFGIFGATNLSRVWYYRLMGATVGLDVTINKGAILGEFDLITIGDGAVLERCIVRPFAAERNTSMYLGRIDIGANAVIGLGSIVAPGTQVPANACIGPNSSSWEAAAADESNRDLASSKIQGPTWVLECFIGLPTQLVAAFIGALPWLGGLVPICLQGAKRGTGDTLRQVMTWFASPERVGYHYLALVLNAVLGPAFLFLAAYCIKQIFDMAIGPVRPCNAASQSQIARLRAYLLRILMPSTRFHRMTDLFGTHYESTSIMARMMGGRIGSRVYWPGTGPSIQDFALLDIGDDVVFGSRSHLVTSDGTGSDFIKIQKGAMVADRVVLLPGVQLGERTVMGSGALTRRNVSYADGTTHVGSRYGEAVCLSSDTSSAVVGVGRRRSLYYTDLERPRPPFASDWSQSSSTTLARDSESEASSITVMEEGVVTSNDIDVEAFTPENDSLRKRSTVVTSRLGSEKGTQGSVVTFVKSLVRRRHQREASVITTEPEKQHEGSDAGPDAEESTPFGRAFYLGLASYRIWSQHTITCYSVLITIVCALFWNVASISAVQIMGRGLKHHAPLAVADHWLRPIILYIYFTTLIAAILAFQTAIVLAFLIGAKWLLLGRRTSGNYSWDKSPYCQRWQLLLKLESLRRHCYGGQGILSLLTGTAWIVAYFRALGLKAGKDCALFAGGMPSLLFTEPDLLTLGDRVCVDDASLVAHINTRGKFDLNELRVGDRSVLRSGSRLLPGATMEADTCLLEHTLVMAGDVVEIGSTYQGWPAEEFGGKRMPTLRVGQVWMKA